MPNDLVAGLAVAGLMIPEGVAYAGIAGLDPARALAAGIAGGFAYALVGRSRFAVVSPTSSSAAILAAALASLPGDDATRAVLATVLVGMTGLIFLGAALFRLGSLSAFVSRPVLRGFAFGLAITIVIRQLPKLLGIAGIATGNIAVMTAEIVGGLRRANPASALIGLAALTLLVMVRARWPRVPVTLAVLAAGILASLGLDLSAHGVALAGAIRLAMPTFDLPALAAGQWARMAQLAVPIALILFAESWGTIRTMALRHGDAIESNRELVALGVANVASALVRGMPVGAGFSAGAASEAAGAHSRLTALTAALAVLLLALFATGLIAAIPEPVLAAVVIAALAHALSPGPLVRLFRLDRDQWIALGAALGVLTLGVLNGMLAAVALSVAALLHTYSRPRISALGRVGDGHDFVDMRQHPDARGLRDVGIYRPNAPLFFANAEGALAEVARMAAGDGAHTIVLSLEQSADLDSTAAEALGEFVGAESKAGRRVILARLHDRARAVLAASGLDGVAATGTFSVADAVAQAMREQ